jgi:hypothetical protein
MRAFLKTNAGKGTMGVCLTALILVWPLVASWLVAGLTLFFAVHHLREAFRRLEADAPAPPRRIDLPDTGTALAVPARGEGAARAALAAWAARVVREIP